MRRGMSSALAASLALALAACVAGPGGGGAGRGFGGGPGLRPIAQPGDVVAVELAFARAAQDEGQWTAFSEYAADQAVMFTPRPVLAKPWLKGRANPPKPMDWQPYQVWSSCDGSLAVSKGAWQRSDGSVGYFVTVWQRQKDGSYKWVLDSGDKLAKPLQQPDMVQADVADCPAGKAGGAFHHPSDGRHKHKRGELPVASVSGTLDDRSGQSIDGSLTWTSHYAANGSRTVSVSLNKGGAMKEIVHSQVSP